MGKNALVYRTLSHAKTRQVRPTNLPWLCFIFGALTELRTYSLEQKVSEYENFVFKFHPPPM